MDGPARTQKQVAGKYKGNLRYFTKFHFLRRLRFLVMLLAVVGGIGAMVWFSRRGSDRFYNPGPLSRSHANLENDCGSCHQMRQNKLMELVSSGQAQSVVSDSLHHGVTPSLLSSFPHGITTGVSYAYIDHACQQCHENHSLHQPNSDTIALMEYGKDLSVVHTGICFDCHREHFGKGEMKLPTGASCITCHDNAERMNSMLTKVSLEGQQASHVTQLRKLADGSVHFIPPQTTNHRQPLFESFENGHPAFEYEETNLRDSDVLRYNHRRHEAPDIPKVNGRNLDCAYCHKPAASGVFYQRVSYEASCQACHSLQFDPKNPELKIPHGDVDKVHAFLHSLPFQYSNLAAKKGMKRPDDVAAFVNQQLIQLRDRIRSGEDFESQVFFTSNPYKTQPGIKSLFPGCAYCHEVTHATNTMPVVTKPVMTDRWLNHGRFTHAKHTAIDCNDCHHASESKDTSDILMPSKESCAQCHRASTSSRVATKIDSDNSKAIERLAVEKQRREGGVSSDCLTCHSFHTPAEVYGQLKKLPGFKEALHGN